MATTLSTDQMRSILSQDDWLRRVARRLFRDGADADDAVQEVWAAEFTHGELKGPRAPWRLAVLRNRQRAALRKGSRDMDHANEMRARGKRFAPATDDVVADLQLREHAAQALLALEEPLRTTLYLRFVSDLSVSEVAERLGVAQSTASERIARGLDKLRFELDQRYGHDRSAWRAVLAPLAAAPVPLRSTTGAGVGVKFAGVGWIGWTAVAMLLGAVWLGLLNRPAESASAADGVLSHVAAAPLSHESHAEGPSPLSDPIEPSRTALSVIPFARAAQDPKGEQHGGDISGAVDEPVRVTATVLLPDGQPAVGAAWEIVGLSIPRRGVWSPDEFTGQTGSDGVIETSFASRDPKQFMVTVELDGYVTASRRWAKLLPGETERLGKIRLERAGDLVGRFVDPRGSLLLGKPWRLRLVPVSEQGLRPSAGLAHSKIDPKTGRFSLQNVSPGKLRLDYFAPGKGWQNGPVAEIAAGETVEMVVVQDGTFEDNMPRELLSGLPSEGTLRLPGGWGKGKSKGPTEKERERKPSVPVELTLELAMKGELAPSPEEVVEAAYLGEEHGLGSYLKGKGTVFAPGTINASHADTLWIRGDDWIARLPGEPSKLVDGATRTVELRLSERRVRFLFNGAPLAKQLLELQVLPMQFATKPRGGSFVTDKDGWATVRLGDLPKGETYRFSIHSKDPAMFLKMIESPWPHPGGEPGDGPLTLEFK